MSGAPLLVELLCEELPPKALKRLGDAFAQGLLKGLQKREMLEGAATVRAFATPRRLGAEISAVKAASESRAIEVKLMPVSVALDASGNATPALAKKLEAAGLAGTDVATLSRRMDGKSEMLFARTTTPAMPLGPYPQLRLYPQVGSAPIRARIRIIRRIVPRLIDRLPSSPIVFRRNVRTPAWFHGVRIGASVIPSRS